MQVDGTMQLPARTSPRRRRCASASSRADRLRLGGDGRGARLRQEVGVKIVPTKDASWAGVRDKLINGELDMAHVLYGLAYGVHLGVAGLKKDMALLTTLNHNGQALTLSKKLADKGAVDGASLAKLMAVGKRPNGKSAPSPRPSRPASCSPS